MLAPLSRTSVFDGGGITAAFDLRGAIVSRMSSSTELGKTLGRLSLAPALVDAQFELASGVAREMLDTRFS